MGHFTLCLEATLFPHSFVFRHVHTKCVCVRELADPHTFVCVWRWWTKLKFTSSPSFLSVQTRVSLNLHDISPLNDAESAVGLAPLKRIYCKAATKSLHCFTIVTECPKSLHFPYYEGECLSCSTIKLQMNPTLNFHISLMHTLVSH